MSGSALIVTFTSSAWRAWHEVRQSSITPAPIPSSSVAIWAKALAPFSSPPARAFCSVAYAGNRRWGAGLSAVHGAVWARCRRPFNPDRVPFGGEHAINGFRRHERVVTSRGSCGLRCLTAFQEDDKLRVQTTLGRRKPALRACLLLVFRQKCYVCRINLAEWF